MRTFRLSARLIVATLLLGIAGCGGGSVGTGVRTLRGENIERKEPRLFDWGALWTPSCPLAVGNREITVEIKSELGFGAVVSKSSAACSFLVPEQAQGISVALSDLTDGEPVEIELAEASCEDGSEISGSARRLHLSDDAAALPPPRWKEGRFLKLLVKVGPKDRGEVRLLDDDFERCRYVVPEDGN